MVDFSPRQWSNMRRRGKGEKRRGRGVKRIERRVGSDGEERMVEGERFSIMEEALRQEHKGSICTSTMDDAGRK